jgi:hypothetical protein
MIFRTAIGCMGKVRAYVETYINPQYARFQWISIDRYEGALSVERNSNGAMLIDLRTTCYGQFVPLHRIFNGFHRVAMYLSECGEWCEFAWEGLPSFRLPFSTDWAWKRRWQGQHSSPGGGGV